MAKEIDPEWKRKVKSVLQACGLIEPDFTGELKLSVVSGGIGTVKKEQTIK